MSLTLVRSGSDSESDEETSAAGPPLTKTRKLRSRTKFNFDWKKEFDFITNVPGDPYR